jgi:acetyl/propionyl-CoA carboxylase alpha subunit
MKRAIGEFELAGIASTLSFGLFVMNHPEFVKGSFDTRFIEKYFKPELKDESTSEYPAAAIAAAYFHKKTAKAVSVENKPSGVSSDWKRNRLDKR